MGRPLLLDLFSGAGGAARGYQRAGFDVVGVDLHAARLRHYPGPTVLGDALQVAERIGHHFDAIHASPPCQAYSVSRHAHNVQHPDLMGPTRELLESIGLPYVIENVPGAPMPDALTLCGTHFGLTATDDDGQHLYLRRHRLFTGNVPLMAPGPCRCAEYKARGWYVGGVYGGGSRDRDHARNVRRGGYTPALHVQQQLMGLDVPGAHLTQAIPPAYSEWVGSFLLDAVAVAA